MKKIRELKSTKFLDRAGISYQRLEMDQAPHTAQDVKNICHCELEEVLKTLLFFGENSAVIAVVDGTRRVDTNKLCRATGHKSLRMATPDEVLRVTSCRVGTVSPFGITGRTKKVMDVRIIGLQKVIAGSGKETVLLELTTEALQSAWDGEFAEIT